jgi:hypothetical protein
LCDSEWIQWIADFTAFHCMYGCSEGKHLANLNETRELRRVVRSLKEIEIPCVYTKNSEEAEDDAFINISFELMIKGIENTARTMEAMEEIDKAIMFFKNLIGDVVDHCKIVT